MGAARSNHKRMSEQYKSESKLRCPACGDVREVSGDFFLLHEGTHDIFCGECYATYEIRTRVSIEITSPPLLKPPIKKYGIRKRIDGAHRRA